MSFLLGAFGPRHQDYTADIVRIAKSAGTGTPQTQKFHNAFIIADQKQSAFQRDIIRINRSMFFVGTLFDRHTHKPLAALPAGLSDITAICKRIWGRYVGISVQEITNQITLVRDPIGLSSLFYCIHKGTLLFATELALLYDIFSEKPSINYDYFIEHIINQNQATSQTPFMGIEELLPGMVLSIDTSLQKKKRYLWEDMCNNPTYITDKEEFEHTLLDTMKQCTAAWTEGTPGICVELSGGADSSGIMFLLRETLPADKKLIAVNFIDSKTPSSNEHRYAQDVANRCKAPLYFIDWHGTSLLDPLPSSWRPDRPSTLHLFSSNSQQISKLALENGCTQIMNGQGGDHVFMAPAPLNALEDRWIEKGVRGSFSTLNELSNMYRMPWWSLIYQSMKSVARYYRGLSKKDPEDTSFLAYPHTQSAHSRGFYLNPFISSCYPAHASRIKSLFHGVAYAERNQRLPAVLTTHPLLSQPLIELALKIPTYQSFHDGYDRIFFRKAISKLTQSSALWRRIKGQTTGSMIKACAHAADEIELLIMNGPLAQQGIINPSWLHDQLTKVKHGQNDNLWPVLHMLTSQLWFNQWNIG